MTNFNDVIASIISLKNVLVIHNIVDFGIHGKGDVAKHSHQNVNASGQSSSYPKDFLHVDQIALFKLVINRRNIWLVHITKNDKWQRIENTFYGNSK